MRIQIETRPRGRLKVLEEFPDAHVSRLEGRNGIGKTLAVRILQLCAGDRPYRPDSASWVSLREGLGEFVVKVSNLRGAKELVWEGSSALWPAPSEDDGLSPVPFRSVKVDGIEASWEQVRRLFSVARLGGEERLVQTLAAEAQEVSDSVRRWRLRTLGETSGPLAELETRLAVCLRLLGQWSADDLRGAAQDLEEATSEEEEKRSGFAQSDARVRECERAVGLRTDLVDLRTRLPGLESRIREIDQRVAKAGNRRAELQKSRDNLIAGSDRGAEWRRELSNAETTANRNRDKLKVELERVASLAGQLGVEPTGRGRSARAKELATLLAELKLSQRELDAAPEMLRLLGSVTTQLASAESAGLGDQVALVGDTGLELTVAETRQGMAARGALLEGQPPHAQWQDLQSRIESTEHLVRICRDLDTAVYEVERYRRLAETNERRIDRALSELSQDKSAQVARIEAQIRELDEELVQLAIERVTLAGHRRVREAISEEAVVSQLTVLLRGLGTTEADLDEELAQALESREVAHAGLLASSERRRTLRQELVRGQAEIKAGAAALETHPAFEWLRSSRSGFEIPRGAPSRQAVALDGVRLRLQRCDERLGSFRSQVGAVEVALAEIGRALLGESERIVEYTQELQVWLSARFSEWFRQDTIRTNLLSPTATDIEVNVPSQEVRWTDRGRKAAQPLESLSSGQQAFAYTRARLGVLDDAPVQTPNRLLVLDEFGAFVAHDLLTELMQYLVNRVSEHPADQVLVILPLAQDYRERQNKALDAGDQERFRELADQVERRGYAIQVVVK